MGIPDPFPVPFHCEDFPYPPSLPPSSVLWWFAAFFLRGFRSERHPILPMHPGCSVFAHQLHSSRQNRRVRALSSPMSRWPNPLNLRCPTPSSSGDSHGTGPRNANSPASSPPLPPPHPGAGALSTAVRPHGDNPLQLFSHRRPSGRHALSRASLRPGVNFYVGGSPPTDRPRWTRGTSAL